MPIALLDQKVSHFLRTAQVITSVSSAVKELIENSIDAGASNIDVKLVENGVSSIEVADNGGGISEADAPLMGLHSHTSKIQDFRDLESLHSYGFRGEALCSLCAVADVSVITKTEQDLAARCYNMNHDGSIGSQEPCHRTVGTTIRAKALFRDTPVRQQILTKSASRDIKALENDLRALAVCQPSLGLTLRVDGKILLAKIPTKSPEESLTQLFGDAYVKQMNFMKKIVPEATLHLAVPIKDTVRWEEIFKTGQYLFVNKRFVNEKKIEKLINKRLAEYFGEKIPARKKLSFVLRVDVPSTDLDINLEPNKRMVLITHLVKILETLDSMLKSYYKLDGDRLNDSFNSTKMQDEKSVESDEYSNSTIGEMDISVDAPLCKKPRIESSRTKRRSSEKENWSLNPVAFGRINVEEKSKSSMIMEPLSQLPVVDLGDDFTSQEINKSKLPKLDPAQVGAILADAGRADPMVPLNKKPTMDDWSRGHINNLQGGKDVRIYGNIVGDEKSPDEGKSDPDTNSSGCRGYLKFSKELRPQIISENPGINFVETAKTLMKRWRDLSSEERGYYRDLAAAADVEKKQKESRKGEKLTQQEATENRKRFVDLLEKMKATKITKKRKTLAIKPIVPLEIDMEIVQTKFHNSHSDGGAAANDRRKVVGPIDENLWIARIGSQIWALSIERLFHGLHMEKSDVPEKTRDTVDELLCRWLVENEGASLLHPIYELP